MKVWITRYALTRGVFETEGTITELQDGSMIEARGHGYFHKPDWHTNGDSARARVSEMLVARINSLEKQVSKLRRLESSVHANGLHAVMQRKSKQSLLTAPTNSVD